MNDWRIGGFRDMLSDFDVKESELSGAKILLASYGYEDYEGDAFVLFERGDKLFEVNAGHCSCYGLEGQWEPEETSKAALVKRLEDGYLFSGNDFKDELNGVINNLPIGG